MPCGTSDRQPYDRLMALANLSTLLCALTQLAADESICLIGLKFLMVCVNHAATRSLNQAESISLVNTWLTGKPFGYDVSVF
jgi:hypothetical protein